MASTSAASRPTEAVLREYPVELQRVDMHVEIERSAEPLDHGDRARTTIRHAVVARANAQEAEHRAEKHGNDRATQVVVPRQLVPQAVRQTENPLHPSAAAAPGTSALPHGHVGEHVVEQVGGSLRHPAAAAARTHRPRFA